MAQVLIPNTEDVAAKMVDGEAILINVTNGMYYSTDQVGGFVWSMIEDQQGLEDIVAAVAQRLILNTPPALIECCVRQLHHVEWVSDRHCCIERSRTVRAATRSIWTHVAARLTRANGARARRDVLRPTPRSPPDASMQQCRSGGPIPCARGPLPRRGRCRPPPAADG